MGPEKMVQSRYHQKHYSVMRTFDSFIQKLFNECYFVSGIVCGAGLYNSEHVAGRNLALIKHIVLLTAEIKSK